MSQIPQKHLVFLDESGANIAMARARGWSPTGMRVTGVVPFNHGRNLTMIGAIRSTGAFALQLRAGAMNAERFVGWARDRLAPQLGRDDVVVLDNLRSHWKPEAIAAIEARGAHVLFLPPYSPDFNPIENVWSIMKAGLRRRAARTWCRLTSAIRSEWGRLKRLNFSRLFQACGWSNQRK